MTLWIYDFMILFVDLYEILFLNATHDIVLIWLDKDSVLISTLKSQSSFIETKF